MCGGQHLHVFARQHLHVFQHLHVVEPPAGGDDAGEEGMPDFSIAGPVACHLGASGVLEDAGGLRITECSIATDVGEVVTTEFLVRYI